jgi:hypothetical protein
VKIIIDQTTYTAITNLSFAPQVDVTGNSLPINEFTCDIQTEDVIGIDQSAELRDSRNKLWAKYYITYAEHDGPGIVHLVAKSPICLLQTDDLPDVMYSGKKAQDALEETLNSLGSSLGSDDWTLDNSLKDIVLNGFCPSQNARDRLTWILFVIGAYVDDAYTEKIRIKPVDEAATLIPYRHTFFRPTEEARDWVTSLSVTTYTFTEGTEEEYESDSDSYMFPIPWIATPQTVTVTNPGAPSGARKNVVTIDGLYLINPNNVSGIVQRLSKYWFNPKEVRLDCINNREYKPGELVTAYTAEDSLVTGYIQQASFQYGLQARSTLQLVGAESIDGAKLTINYKYGSKRIGRAQYFFPVGMAFSVTNPYIDREADGHRIIYRPLTENATGTMASGGTTVNVDYEIALDLYQNVLHIINVDEVQVETVEDRQIGVIS